ncbi:hypothetical protein P4388_34070 [Bacillus thuringiensis]|uniref:hypothetical protein n=1 Tax=Bacillus toyonensis TaxID=155322 RepID=UPI000B4417EA|nr:hypothetical protein [Bacillus toyonensis]MED3201346.1 hypothetical protein [Bacillus toyonensis]MED3353530.1 hypothetical protein [Bacillus thuringiensis]OTX13123.1 hypothetical protein BK712_02295 [Bacillus thuringiensis serovar seoulensis]
MNTYSLIPPTKYGDKDPQSLLYLNPSLSAQKLVKMYNKYIFFKQLQLAEDMAGKMGFILLPYDCMHWERRQQFRDDRSVKVGRNSYFMMTTNELTRTEQRKLQAYIQSLHE